MMRKWQIAVLVILTAVLAVAAFGQDKPKVELKPEVKLTLVQDQNDLYKLVLQMKNLEAQYQQGQAQLTKFQSKLQQDTHEALTKSGIDAEKYEINAETFDVTPKPVVAAKTVVPVSPNKPLKVEAKN
jgi:hypothetical protein